MNQCGNWQKYLSRNPLQRFLIQNFLDAVVTMTRTLDILTVLDAGCAEGFVSRRVLQSRPDLKVVGVDVDSLALARGRRLHPCIAFQHGDVRSLPFRDRSFDLVLCTEVLEHLPCSDPAFSELRRVTRGYCLLSVPHEPFFRLSNLMRGKNVSRFGDDIDHYQHWTGSTFRKLASRYFRPVVSRYPFPWQLFLGEAN
jgi:SAM-dependent methyltransferase